MKHIKKVIVLFILSVSLLVTGVGATEVSPYVLLDSSKGVYEVVDTVNSQTQGIAEIDLLKVDSEKRVSFNKLEYLQLDTGQKRDVMKTSLNSVKNSSMSGRDKSRLFNFVEEQDTGTSKAIRALDEDTGADTSRASALLNDFGVYLVVGLVIGLLLLIIMIWIAVSTAIDLFAISITPLHQFVMSGDGKRAWFVSPDAAKSIRSIYEGDRSEKKRHYLFVYLQARFISILILSVVVTLFVTGVFWNLMGWFVDVAQAFISSI